MLRHCIHLRSLSARHFGIVKTTGLKATRPGHLQRHHLLLKFNENHQSVEKLLGGGGADITYKLPFTFE
jgi:hypothetical protein